MRTLDVITEIHNNYYNGNFKEMVAQIDKYGEFFWQDYRYWLSEIEWYHSDHFTYFSGVTVAYFRIKNKEN